MTCLEHHHLPGVVGGLGSPRLHIIVASPRAPGVGVFPGVLRSAHQANWSWEEICSIIDIRMV